MPGVADSLQLVSAYGLAHFYVNLPFVEVVGLLFEHFVCAIQLQGQHLKPKLLSYVERPLVETSHAAVA